MLNKSDFFSHTNVNSYIWLLIGIIITWLFWSASIVGIETGDGYLTLSTAQYFLGMNEGYGFQRGPFLALYLLPSEWLSNSLELHPLDVRAHHYLTALLHSIYIIAIWFLLKNHFKDFGWQVAVAFIATIPSFIFFSYAIFISPDIFPGLILLGMILLTVKFEKNPTWSVWIALVFLGFLAVIIKQTYALFWVSILISCWLYYSIKINTHLFLAAATSAIITWLAYAWFLQGATPPDTPWLTGPIQQILFIINQYEIRNTDSNTIFAWWVYVRNFYNFGILTATLIIPSIIYALFFFKHKDKSIQLIALSWIILFLSLQSITFKEVRYLTFLAPLSAFLLVPFLHSIYSSKYRNTYILLLLISFSFDLPRNINEASRISNVFYQGMLRNYFEPTINITPDESSNNSKISRIIMINPTGFSPDIFSPLKGDRYHRTFHLSKYNIQDLYSLKNEAFISYNTGSGDIKISHEVLMPGDMFLFSNESHVRSPPWDHSNMIKLTAHYLQFIAVAENITLLKKGTQFHLHSKTNDARPVFLVNSKDYNFMILQGNKSFDRNELSNLLGKATTSRDSIELTGLRISRLCNNTGCFDMEKAGQSLY